MQISTPLIRLGQHCFDVDTIVRISQSNDDEGCLVYLAGLETPVVVSMTLNKIQEAFKDENSWFKMFVDDDFLDEEEN